MKEGNLVFDINGEFITEITREWFYTGEKSYETVMKILMDSMTGTDSARPRRSEGKYDSRYISSRNIRTGRRRTDATEHEHLERNRKAEESRGEPAAHGRTMGRSNGPHVGKHTKSNTKGTWRRDCGG